MTDLGDIDLLGEVAGGETYQTLLPRSFEVEAFTAHFKCIDLPTLVRIKEAAGRRKDFEAIAELRVLSEEIAEKHGSETIEDLVVGFSHSAVGAPVNMLFRACGAQRVLVAV
jgi:hypothetical protein